MIIAYFGQKEAPEIPIRAVLSPKNRARLTEKQRLKESIRARAFFLSTDGGTVMSDVFAKILKFDCVSMLSTIPTWFIFTFEINDLNGGLRVCGFAYVKKLMHIFDVARHEM